LQKTQEFGGGGFNFGNVGEGVFAAAIAARFINKMKDINAGDVTNIIRKLPNAKQSEGTSVITKLSLDSENQLTSIIDKVNLTIELAKKDMASLQAASPKFSELLPAAVAWVNQFNVRDHAEIMYTNDIVNIIDVKSLGVSGGTKTKVDTYVEIDGERTDINVSLKTKSIAQFGQQAGMQYKQYPERPGAKGKRKGQVELWASFGLMIDSDATQKDFYKHAGVRNWEKAFDVTFSKALLMYQGLTDTDRGEKLARGIAYHATLNEKNVEIVDLAFDKLTIYRFTSIVDKMKAMKIKAIKETRTGLPRIQFFDEGGNVIIQIRCARAGMDSAGRQYFRTYVEKGKGLLRIIGLEIKLGAEAT